MLKNPTNKRQIVRSVLAGFALMATPAMAQQATDAINPETKTALTAKENVKPVSSKKWMVAVANPHAATAAAEVLKAGGNAVDAAIAAQVTLGLVEPQSSGLGGGAFLVYYDASAGKVTTLDGRETAPMAATPQLFQDDNGEPLKFFDAVVGGRSVGVPGTPALLQDMHKRWGSASWDSLFTYATGLADRGFAVSHRLAGLVEQDKDRLATQPTTASYFLPDGEPIKAGTTLKNPEYAETLRTLSKGDLASFYGGKIGEAIVAAVQGAKGNPGVMQLVDLANYEIKERDPVCVAYRGYDVCGMGPPSSGALTVGQILGMLEPFDLKTLGPGNPEGWRLIGDASRLAFADRGRYMADIDFVPMPLKGLTAPDYLAKRAEALKTDKALTKEEVIPGEPAWDHASLLWADDASLELPSTSHFSIVDEAGNAVSMTTTIENGFGSRIMASGFLLNNELTDFSFKTHNDGYPIANRVEPGKRPRSSMSPTIVMKDGKPYLVIGSPGGSRIIGYVAKTIIAHLDWGMDIQQAIASPHFVNRFGAFDIEENTPADGMKATLEGLGYEVKVRDLTSGLHGIVVKADGLEGGADPRREGVVMGE